MNIAFFLTPKEEIAYEYIESSMRQGIEKMEHYRFAAIPIIDKKGKYIGTLTEGDLLWKIKNTKDLEFKNSSKIPLRAVERRLDNKPVTITSNIEDLFGLIIHQNFVPVVDDNFIFIGIIKRSDILNYFNEKLKINGLM